MFTASQHLMATALSALSHTRRIYFALLLTQFLHSQFRLVMPLYAKCVRGFFAAFVYINKCTEMHFIPINGC